VPVKTGRVEVAVPSPVGVLGGTVAAVGSGVIVGAAVAVGGLLVPVTMGGGVGCVTVEPCRVNMPVMSAPTMAATTAASAPMSAIFIGSLRDLNFFTGSHLVLQSSLLSYC